MPFLGTSLPSWIILLSLNLKKCYHYLHSRTLSTHIPIHSKKHLHAVVQFPYPLLKHIQLTEHVQCQVTITNYLERLYLTINLALYILTLVFHQKHLKFSHEGLDIKSLYLFCHIGIGTGGQDGLSPPPQLSQTLHGNTNFSQYKYLATPPLILSSFLRP